MLKTYREDGLPEDFINRISKTPASDMWYPTRDELIAANVVNRISLGGETASLGSMVHSRQEMLLLLRGDSVMKAYEARFPGTMSKAADAAWAKKQEGAPDSEVLTAARTVFSGLLGKAVRQSNDEMLVSFGQLFLAESRAAQSVSPDTCIALLNGSLNISQTLPKEISEMDRAVTIKILSSEPVSAPTEQQKASGKAALIQALRAMAPADAQLIANPPPHMNPTDQCRTTISLYEKIGELPEREQADALRFALSLE